MKVVIAFDFSDEDREAITIHQRQRVGAKGLPRLATRAMIRAWVREAIDNHWLAAADLDAATAEWNRSD